MATPRYLGHAAGVKQVNTLTIANTWAQNDTVTLTIDNIDVVITIGTLVTTAQVATTIKQVFNGETLTDTDASYTPNSGVQTIGQFTEMVATVSSSVVTFTANDAGKPFTMTAGETTAGDGTATMATATAATGKYHHDNADNFSGNAVPADNDTLVFDQGSVGPKYGFATTIVQPVAVYIPMPFTGLIGLPEQNIDNPSYPYAEYRTKYLTFDNNSVTCAYYIGDGEGQGSSRIRIDAGAGRSTWNIYASGSREVLGVPPILLKGTHASNELNNLNGDVGVAFYAGETATLATLRNGNGPSSQAKTYCGPGVTLSSAVVTMAAGELTLSSAVGTVNMTGGEAWHRSSGTITSLNVWGGHWNHENGTVTTLKIGPSGIFDKSKNMQGCTITNPVEMHKGAKFLDPSGVCTISGGFTLVGCTLDEVEIDVGFGRTVSIS